MLKGGNRAEKDKIYPGSLTPKPKVSLVSAKDPGSPLRASFNIMHIIQETTVHKDPLRSLGSGVWLFYTDLA